MAGRGAFNTRIGFLLAAVGSAVGLGNLWRFPYLTSQNGGSAFLFLYLIFLFLIGLPALMAELSLGRRTSRNSVDAFAQGERRRFTWVGIVFIATAVLLLSYYSVIAGWALRYMFEAGTAPYFADAGAHFGAVSTSYASILFHLLFMAITVGILVRGVSSGIERANLIMMPILFAAVIALAVYGNVQAGAGGGRSFFLQWEPSRLWPQDCTGTCKTDWTGVSSLFSAAAGQTFFSIGLGLGTMLTYASYIDRNNDLAKTGFTIGFADTGVAVLAGFMVFPLIFALGLDYLVSPDNASSVGGLFIALPTAFGAIGGTLGGFMALGFFILLAFAALSSAISLLEVPISYLVDRYPQWGRPRAVLLMGISVYLLGLPSAVSLDFLGIADSIVSNVLLLFGGLMLTIYVGWIKPDTLQEISVGRTGFDWGKVFRPIIRYPLPVFLAALLGLGIVTLIQGF